MQKANPRIKKKTRIKKVDMPKLAYTNPSGSELLQGVYVSFGRYEVRMGGSPEESVTFGSCRVYTPALILLNTAV